MKKFLCIALWIPLLAGAGSGQEKKPSHYQVAGRRDGPSHFPAVDYPETRAPAPGRLDFAHYHGYDEVLSFLRQWQSQRPDLLDLYVVAQSFSGRDIWQVTLTNRKTGKDTDKPAMYLEGNRHSGEVTGAEAALLFINRMLEGYGRDASVTQLLDENAYYVRVHNNPDGSELYLRTAQSNRSSVRPHDSDGDGLLDEDPAEDLDGDGFIRQMRRKVKQGTGAFVIDPADRSRRLMKRVGAGKGDYEVSGEGLDNDGDGKTNEDGVGGLDLHRNYPQNWRPEAELTGRGWTQTGAGAYPLSELETRAVVLFLLSHPNVSVVQTMDTAVPMHLRPPSTSRAEESMLPEDQKIYLALDEEGRKLSGYPHAGDVYWEFANIGSRYFEEEGGREPRGRPLFGHSPDFGYFGFGAVWYGDELWCGGRVRDYDGDGRVSDLEVLRWNDEALGGAGFAPWKRYLHPHLGEVEIGGYNPKFFSQNPPPQLLLEWIEKQQRFNMLLASSLPRVRIRSAAAQPAAGRPGVTEVRATIENSGRLPTAMAMAERVKIVRPDRIELSFDGKKAALAEGKAEIEIGRLQPGEAREVKWLVKPQAAAVEATLTYLSTRGGVQRQTLRIAPETTSKPE